MRNLLNFLLKYINIIVFLILEGIALYWLTNGNSYHNSRVVRAVQGVTRGLNERINNARTYLSLREINSSLASENSDLRNRLEKLTQKGDPKFYFCRRLTVQAAISVYFCQGNKQFSKQAEKLYYPR